MAKTELSKTAKRRLFIDRAFIIGETIIAISLVIAAVAFILLWLISVVLSFMPNNSLMPWIASGVSAPGLLFIFLAAIPGIPGIIWASRLVDHVTSPLNHILKITVWIGKMVFKVGVISAILILILLIFR